MPWISDHYEKAALAVALIIAVALAYTGLQNKSAVEIDFESVPRGEGNDDPSVKDGDKVATAKSSLQIKQQWTQGEVNGRPVDLFTGVQLFVNKENRTEPVDLPNSADVHSSIPNKWWMEYRIDPGYGDSPQRDEDKDGFSNLEEFVAKTNPTDNRSHPNLIKKLVYLKNESIEWVVRPSGYPTDLEPAMGFTYLDTKRQENKTDAAAPIAKNGVFFLDGPAKQRFKYLGFENREVRNEQINDNETVTIIKIEDLKPNKKGQIYEMPANFRQADKRKFSKFDRTAILSLEALGFNGQEFNVEELTDFALPLGSEKKRYRMMEVLPDRLVVRETLEDGSHQVHEISKRP